MSHRSILRRATAAGVVLAACAGLGPAVAPSVAYAADDPAAQEFVLPAGVRFLPRDETLLEAGTTGFLHYQEGSSGRQWTDYATGETRGVTPAFPYGHSGLRAALGEKAADGTRPVRITDLASGTVTTVTMPAGYVWVPQGYTADSVVAYQVQDGLISALSLLRVVEGKTEERAFTGLPEGMKSARVNPQQQDGRGAVLGLAKPGGTYALHLLDYETARVTALPESFRPGSPIVLGERYVLTYPQENPTVITVDRRNPEAAPVTVTMPKPVSPERTFARFAVVGDWIVFSRLIESYAQPHTPGARLMAIPVGGGEPRELLRYSDEHFAIAPDGSVLATGGRGARDWAVRRISVGPDGTPVVSTVREVPPVGAKVEALALGGGKLSYVSNADGSGLTALYDHDVAVVGTPAVGERSLRFRMTTTAPSELYALGNGRSAYADGSRVMVPIDDTSLATVDVPATAWLRETTGRYSVIDTSAGQYIGDIEKHRDGNVALARAETAATVWGSTLWMPGKTAGSVRWYDLKSKKTSGDLALGSGCIPNGLQAVGRWVYWYCGSIGTAGVWDQKTRKSTPVPADYARLGDGFLVRKDAEAGKLLLTDFHTGSGTATTSTFADVPLQGRWAVDKFGGHVAYTDAEQRIHIKPVTVPRAPIGFVEGEAENWIDIDAGTDQDHTWDADWQLSRPPVGWSVAFKDAAGRTVRTIASTERAGARISASWDGKGDDGRVVLGGQYTWTLNADAGDGSGARVVQGGKIAVSGGATSFRDYDGNGAPELLTKQTTVLTAHEGMSASADGGSFLSQSGGWAETTHVLPFGDMDGDRCNDMVVRTTAGDLYRYSGRCHGIPATSAPKAKIGSGFNAFDALVTPGDLTGDGRSDLLARMRTTGALYLYADNGAGGLKAGVKLGTASWKGLTLIGAGDLNGDGRGDLLARDAGGELWRYDGTGTGTLKPRVLVFRDWGAGRNAFASAGDLDGDGRNDLVSRDTSGRLLRNSGDGKGSFRGTVQIGTGWQRYTAIY